MTAMERTDLGRIVAFTDGVMAVAITLLVLNIEVPDVPAGSSWTTRCATCSAAWAPTC